MYTYLCVCVRVRAGDQCCPDPVDPRGSKPSAAVTRKRRSMSTQREMVRYLLQHGGYDTHSHTHTHTLNLNTKCYDGRAQSKKTSKMSSICRNVLLRMMLIKFWDEVVCSCFSLLLLELGVSFWSRQISQSSGLSAGRQNSKSTPSSIFLLRTSSLVSTKTA